MVFDKLNTVYPGIKTIKQELASFWKKKYSMKKCKPITRKCLVWHILPATKIIADEASYGER